MALRNNVRVFSESHGDKRLARKFEIRFGAIIGTCMVLTSYQGKFLYSFVLCSGL